MSKEKEIFDILRIMEDNPDNIGYCAKRIQAIIEAERNDARIEGYTEGYENGHTDGSMEGHSDGYEEGKKAGYDEGYYAGQDDACERVSSVLSVDRIERNNIIRRIRG